MADNQSTVFSFTRVDNFLELLIDNDNIKTTDFTDSENKFKIQLAQSCEDNISQNLNANGTLNTNVVSLLIGQDSYDGDCSLVWQKGVNNNRYISLTNSSVNYELDDGTYMLKGAFIVHKTTGIVLAYSINSAPVPVKNYINLPVDSMIWSIVSQVYEG